MNKRTIKTHFITGALALILLLNLSCFAFAEESASTHYDASQIGQFSAQILNWASQEPTLGNSSDGKLFTPSFLSTAGDSGDWWAFGVGRAGAEEDYTAYLTALSENVSSLYAKNEGKLSNALTDYHRIILTVLALGGDPSSIGTYDEKPINLLQDGLFSPVPPTAQGVNAILFELLCLDAKDYILPDGLSFTRDSLICDLLKEQTADGAISASWGVDPDFTSMAVMALAPYMNSDKKYSFVSNQIKEENQAPATIEITAKEAVNSMLNYLSSIQTDSGAIENWGPNPCSTAQAIIALSSAGIDCQTDQRFIKNGNTLLSALISYQCDNGGFSMSLSTEEQPASPDAYTSNQALQALAAYQRLLEGKTSLYDHKEGSIGLNETAAYPSFDLQRSKITVSGSFSENTTALVACYKNGSLIGTHVAALTSVKDNSYEIDFSALAAGYDSLRLMLWDGVQQLSPKTVPVSFILR